MLQAIDICKTFQNTPALRSVNLHIEEGEFVSVVGRSGSGKSTLLAVCSTLLAPDSGQLIYKGQNVSELDADGLNQLRHTDFSVIFQFHHLMPYLTAEENTLLPFMNAYRSISAAATAKARECLRRVGLDGKGDRLPGELSGGEQQRVAIARALVKDSRILFADEPTGSLDRETGESVMALLRELNRDGLTVIMVTHDSEYAKMGTRIVELADGDVC
ncbi:ABC transporter ATP-binding protein [Paucidesulfovibrio longus]|uniref:ABC transporter ATP-binding protein n=1 Tax=Paucidesulfovibrio longus TaxID=889 RepID=UPI0003B388FE|nr:ABC transporter ATP-binding protein [Paucidesulfovibrio longus]